MAWLTVPVLVTADSPGVDPSFNDVGGFTSGTGPAFFMYDGSHMKAVNHYWGPADVSQFPKLTGTLPDGRRWAFLWFRSAGLVPEGTNVGGYTFEAGGTSRLLGKLAKVGSPGGTTNVTGSDSPGAGFVDSQ